MYNKFLWILILFLLILISTSVNLFLYLKLEKQDIMLLQTINGVLYNHSAVIQKNDRMLELIRSTVSAHIDHDIRLPEIKK